MKQTNFNIIILLTLLVSCSYTPTKETSAFPEEWFISNNQTIVETDYQELLFAYNSPFECTETIINIFPSGDPTYCSLVSEFIIGIDIKNEFARLKSILVSKSNNYENRLSVVFVSQTRQPREWEFNRFDLSGNELVSVFRYTFQNTEEFQKEDVIVCISRTDTDYFTEMYFESCGVSGLCGLYKLPTITPLQGLRNYEEVVAKLSSINDSINICNIFNHNNNDFYPVYTYSAYFIGEYNDENIRNRATDTSHWIPCSYAYHEFAELYNIDLKGFWFTDKVYFRQNICVSEVIEICFVSSVPWYDYVDDRVRSIESFIISGKDDVTAVFTFEDSASFVDNQFLVVQSRTGDSIKYDVYNESCGNHSCGIHTVDEEELKSRGISLKQIFEKMRIKRY